MRVYELAQKLNLESKELLKELKQLGIQVKSHMSSLDEKSAKAVVEALSEEKEKEKEKKKLKISVSEGLSVAKLALKIGVKPNELIKSLMNHNVFASLNEKLTRNALEIASKAFGFEIKIPVKLVEEKIPEKKKIETKEAVKLVPRPPVVTVMGHVDHGKTSLLDAIRNTEVAKSEKGGITQHIGACSIKLKNGEVVFLDTPGHEAFTAMRARGAQVTDIVVLVVAADDGVMPQTIEAIDHARAANVPIVVAVNKIDRPDADPNRIRRQLHDYGLVPEEFGGNTVCVNVSATKKQGLDELLEMLLLEAEMLELKANAEGPAKGTIIEAKLDRQRGPVATVLVQEGRLKVGDYFVAGVFEGKVRAMFDGQGKRVSEATVSLPVEVVGFSGVPDAGDTFQAFRSADEARQTATERGLVKRDEELRRTHHITLNELYQQIQSGKLKELKVIVKGDVQGSVEPLVQSLEGLSTDQVKVKVIHSGVGEINEADVMLAAASDAIIVGFHVGQGERIGPMAREEDVDIRIYHVIYDVISDVKKALEGLLEPEIREVVIGKAEVRQVFETSKGKIAGCYVTEGKVVQDYQARVIREKKEIHKGRISSLRRFKESVREVGTDFECGIAVAGFNDSQEGDIIEVFKIEKE